MKVLMNKRCPKCGGNFFLEEDSFGYWGYCLQCGYECDPENMIKSPERLPLSRRDKPSSPNVNSQSRPEVMPELLQGHLVAKLKQD